MKSKFYVNYLVQTVGRESRYVMHSTVDKIVLESIKGSVIITGVQNACSVNNGDCSHFCIPTPDGTHVCACPDASNRLPVMPADGQNCLSSTAL